VSDNDVSTATGASKNSCDEGTEMNVEHTQQQPETKARPGTSAKPFVYLYTTAGGTKLNYRRGILDALCYPNDHIIQYRYRLQEISPDVQALSDKEKIPAVIILVFLPRLDLTTFGNLDTYL
jgi:hypothetical protein